jgi:hypothetical protein
MKRTGHGECPNGGIHPDAAAIRFRRPSRTSRLVPARMQVSVHDGLCGRSTLCVPGSPVPRPPNPKCGISRILETATSHTLAMTRCSASGLSRFGKPTFEPRAILVRQGPESREADQMRGGDGALAGMSAIAPTVAQPVSSYRGQRCGSAGKAGNAMCGSV